MNRRMVPFARSLPIGAEAAYLRRAIASGQLAGDGDFGKRCERFLEKTLGHPRALLTPSCTHALELAALLLDLRPGDEVILPSFTFVSTANAFVLRGARPVFVDIRPDTFNLDEGKVARALTRKTRALVVVHYGGLGCEMAPLQKLARAHGLPLIEDNAHGLFGRHAGRWLGTFGDLATVSFHQTKNFSCGEGGALLINRKSWIRRAEILREKGTDRARFLRGETDRYTWRDLGSSYLPSELCSAYLLGQLEGWRKVQRTRKRIWMEYHRGLRDWCRTHGLEQPFVAPGRAPAWHVYSLLAPTREIRDRLLAELRRQNVHAVFHYLPLHSSPFARAIGARHTGCPVAEEVAARIVRLPLHPGLTHREVRSILARIRALHWTRRPPRLQGAGMHPTPQRGAAAGGVLFAKDNR